MTMEDYKLHMKSHHPPCGQAAADGVNCFRFVSIQICQPDGGADCPINHFSSVMPCLNESLASGLFAFSLANSQHSDCVGVVGGYDLISPGL